MKKRILSTVLAATMLLSSSIAAFAATDYEGLKPLQTAETILDELTTDAGGNSWGFTNDVTWNDTQRQVLENANTDFSMLDTNDGWNEYIKVVYEDRKTDYVTGYMKILKLVEDGNTEVGNALKSVDETYDTTDLPLKETVGKLDSYQDAVADVINAHVEKFQGELDEATKKKYVLMASKPVFQAIFSAIGAGIDSKSLEFNYGAWLKDDTAKKLLAILFGEALTRELAEQGNDSGIVYNVKKYVKNNINSVKEQFETIFNDDEKTAVDNAYKFLGYVIYNAYACDENDKEAVDLQKDIKMLFGDGGDTQQGAFEIAMDILDSDSKVANVWINLILSEYVQINIPSGRIADVNETPVSERTELNDNTSITFKTENLENFGMSGNLAALNTGCFDVACFVDGEKTDKVVLDADSKIQIKEDSSKGTEYDAYLVLYRESADGGVSTFIESYPVTIVNEEKSDYVPSGNGGGVRRYTVTYESNGGTVFTADTYSKGATIELTKVPKKDGYVFGGWYLDAALTQPAKSIVMNSSITVYAAWVKDGGSVVSKVEIPEMLNGGEHFAYVVGYPEGDVRPQANITRAETVTILFRLLKDDVRKANITEENIFTDVNSGDWYNTAVSTLAALDIVNGRTETEFMPNEYITRAEFATIFARFAEYAYDRAEQFTDISGHWAEKNILEVTAYGWIAGYENNTFRPDNRITRAEAMTLINRVLKRVPENKDDLLEGMNVWSDNTDTSAWYYIAIQEATNSHEFTMKNDSNETWTKLTANKDWTEYEK